MSEYTKIEIQNARDIIANFDFDGDLITHCKIIGDIIAPHVSGLAVEYWDFWVNLNLFPELKNPEHLKYAQNRTAQYLMEKMNDIDQEKWVVSLAAIITDTYRRGVDLHLVFAASANTQRKILSLIQAHQERLGDTFQSVLETASTASALELAVMARCYNENERVIKGKERQEHAAQFETSIGITTHDVAHQTATLRGQAGHSSQMAHGMLSKASEVAAASEQSAVAMREAAQTAAGLIRAIEDARSEVETASQVANLAVQQANDGAAATDTLSEQSQSIDSILSLIREIAGQTNLLALNATIEAARAGDAGRGFAVVAQEVKSLANQTAMATDEIAKKISAIQNATKLSVESNNSIRTTVEEVRVSAERIRHAMEEQAQTVTMITASVDETALAADLMSNTISAIRCDTENVVSEIASLEHGFSMVDDKISSLQENAQQYVARLTA